MMMRESPNRRPKRCSVRPSVEVLEDRLAPARPAAPAIRFDVTVLHELGHSLGLQHNNVSSSIMYPYINNNYNFANFATDPAVTTFQDLYSAANIAAGTTPWKDSLDPNPGNGVVEITYSFPADNTLLEQGNKKNNLAGTFGTKLSAAKDIIRAQFDRWEQVSDGKVIFTERTDGGQAYNVSGAAQNDSRFGDIRIGAHKFDTPGNTLAHAYFPPPNAGILAGDAHFASEEHWIDSAGNALTSNGSSSGGQGGNGGNGNGNGNQNAHLGHDHDDATLPTTAVLMTAPAATAPQPAGIPPVGDVPRATQHADTVQAVGGREILPQVVGGVSGQAADRVELPEPITEPEPADPAVPQGRGSGGSLFSRPDTVAFRDAVDAVFAEPVEEVPAGAAADWPGAVEAEAPTPASVGAMAGLAAMIAVGMACPSRAASRIEVFRRAWPRP